jgi:hypothetical protein
MREFIPTHLISAGTSSPRPLPATDAPLGNPSVVRLDESHSTVQDILAGTFADAVMVLSRVPASARKCRPPGPAPTPTTDPLHEGMEEAQIRVA